VALALLGGALAGAGGSTGTGSSSTASPTSSSGGGLRTATISGATVLTNAAGRTLYSFAPDTATKSVCNGSCAAYWPPVSGRLKAGAGVTGKLSTITRADGSTQEVYNGHPLYTYIGDTGPGQANGNNLNLNGGLWKVVPVSG
jgi:predicted lipoprotein with Yx(FWY)xxD motif